jgi:hypothetical protein
MAAKPTYEEYILDVLKELDGEDLQKAGKAFEFNMRAAVQGLHGSEELKNIIRALNGAKHSYSSTRPELLFYPNDAPEKIAIVSKPFESSLNKIYRSNVLFNRKYPAAPPDGFLPPKQMYENIDDLLRARLICKYMDGPEHVCLHLEEACKGNGIEYKFKDVSTDAGYYAWHFYFRYPADLSLSGNIETKPLWVELQITTQLAEVITILTHELYEERRAGKAPSEGSRWKWDATSNRFRSAYLGHGLHLLEGIIQSLKDDLVERDVGEPSPQAQAADLQVVAEQEQPAGILGQHSVQGAK